MPYFTRVAGDPSVVIAISFVPSAALGADLTVFSFNGNKTVTAGGGGAVAGDDAALCRRVRHLTTTARCGAEYDHDAVGFNYRMTDIQGSLGCAQMDRAEAIIMARRRLAARYDELLAGLDWLERPAEAPRYFHAYQAYVCTFRPERPSAANLEQLHRRRNRLMADLAARGIATRQGTHAPVLTGYYAQKYHLAPGRYPHAVAADRLTLALPLFPQMTDDQQALVVDSLTDVFAEAPANR